MRKEALFIQRIAKQAGKVALGRFGKDGVHHMKSENAWDMVTKADLLCERMIISAIRRKYPAHGIIAEESGHNGSSSEYVWIVDPIDGTLNFVSGVPHFAVMICLARRGVVELSAVYFPAMKELFFAKRGGGAYLNGKRIRCSRAKRLDQSFGCGSASLHGRTALFLKNLLEASKKQNIQMGTFGSIGANACYVACGRRDWTVPLKGQLHDFAPISLILKEAGCKITDTKGRRWKLGDLEMVAANPALHRELLKLTKNL